MESTLTYRGRTISAEDAAFIQQLIDQNPMDSRRRLSVKLCQAWDWRQANGAYRDMVCRGLMLALHRAGHIQLPVKKRTPNNPLARRRRPGKIAIDQSPIEGKLSALKPLWFKQVRRTDAEKLFNRFIGPIPLSGIHSASRRTFKIYRLYPKPAHCVPVLVIGG